MTDEQWLVVMIGCGVIVCFVAYIFDWVHILLAKKREEEWPEVRYEVTTRCPHGEDPAECDACMRESDFQYDASRESR